MGMWFYPKHVPPGWEGWLAVQKVRERFWNDGIPSEVCECGHTDLAHGPLRGLPASYGRGPCAQVECACERWSFAAFTAEFQQATERG